MEKNRNVVERSFSSSYKERERKKWRLRRTQLHRACTRTWAQQRAKLLQCKQRTQKGLCKDLGNEISDYGHKAATDKIRTSWEKLFQNVGTKYGQDINNDLNKTIKVNIVTPVQSTEVLVRHTTREALVRMDQSNIQESLRAQVRVIWEAATSDPSNEELTTKI